MNNVTPSGAAEKIRVWVIDDNKPYCVILQEVINRSPGMSCEKYFTSAKNAIRELEAAARRPQVLLLDIMMPQMTGLDAIKHFLRAAPGLIIIMLTSLDEDEGVRAALKQGAKGYLLKTSTQDDIVRSIEQSVAGGVPIDPMVTKLIVQAYTGPVASSEHYHLSVREIEIIKQIAAGKNSREAAKMLNISYYTVESHLKHIFTKLDVSNRHAMVAKAMKEGLA